MSVSGARGTGDGRGSYEVEGRGTCHTAHDTASDSACSSPAPASWPRARPVPTGLLAPPSPGVPLGVDVWCQ